MKLTSISKRKRLILRKYYMKKNIVVIEGDGIGPEVTRQSVKVLNAIAECFHHEFHYRIA